MCPVKIQYSYYLGTNAPILSASGFGRESLICRSYWLKFHIVYSYPLLVPFSFRINCSWVVLTKNVKLFIFTDGTVNTSQFFRMSIIIRICLLSIPMIITLRRVHLGSRSPFYKLEYSNPTLIDMLVSAKNCPRIWYL